MNKFFKNRYIVAFYKCHLEKRRGSHAADYKFCCTDVKKARLWNEGDYSSFFRVFSAMVLVRYPIAAAIYAVPEA